MKQYFLCSLVVTSLLSSIAPARAENLEHTQQLISTNQCSGCDLSGVGLIYANLSGADLSTANLSQANLSRVDLRTANLRGANLAGAILFNADLSGADLSGADLRGADLRGAILYGANLQDAQVERANFLGAVGLPPEIATVENLYALGLAEAQRGNHQGAINQFNQVIQLQPDFANAYLARSMALLRLGEWSSALEDAQRSQQLYLAAGNEQGQQVSTQVIEGIQGLQEAAEEQQEALEGGSGIGTNFLGLLGSVASLLLQFGLP